MLRKGLEKLPHCSVAWRRFCSAVTRPWGLLSPWELLVWGFPLEQGIILSKHSRNIVWDVVIMDNLSILSCCVQQGDELCQLPGLLCLQEAHTFQRNGQSNGPPRSLLPSHVYLASGFGYKPLCPLCSSCQAVSLKSRGGDDG